MPCFFGYCEGAVCPIITAYTRLHRPSFKLKFETLFESILQAVADSWQKISGCFKHSTSIVFQQCQNKVNFQRKGSSVVSKFLLNLSKGKQRCLFIREHLKILIRC